MKISVSSYSFGAYAQKEQLGVLGIMEKAKEMGFDGIEFVDSIVPDVETAQAIAAKAEELGIETLSASHRLPW